MVKLLLIAAAIAALVLFIVLEGRRQQRNLERRGIRGGGGRPSLIGTGLLELQSMLEPDRKVETIRADMRDRDRLHPEHRPARPGDDAPPDEPAAPADRS